MSLFSPLVNIVKTIIEQVKGQNGNVITFITKLVSYVPNLISSINQVITMKSNDGKITPDELKVLVNEALSEFDAVTGQEGLSFFGSNTPEEKASEEKALDHFKEFIRFTVYRQYGITE